MALQYNLAKVYEISENDTDFALQIVSLFLEEVPAEMKSIKTAIEDKDYEDATLMSEDMVDNYEIINGRPHKVS